MEDPSLPTALYDEGEYFDPEDGGVNPEEVKTSKWERDREALRSLNSYTQERFPAYIVDEGEEKIFSSVEQRRGVQQSDSALPTFSVSDATRRSFAVCDKLLSERKKGAKQGSFRLFSSAFSSRGSRKYFAFGPSPDFASSPDFSGIVDPARRGRLNKQNVIWSIFDSVKQLKSAHSAIETGSFVSWNLGSIFALFQETAEVLKSAVPCPQVTEALANMDKGMSFVNVVDRAQSSSIHLQSTSLTNQLVKLRSSYVDLVAKDAPAERRASLIYSPLAFDNLFLESDISLISSNLRDIDTRAIARRQSTPKRGGSAGVLSRPRANLSGTPSYKRGKSQPSSYTPSRPQQPRKRRGGKST